MHVESAILSASSQQQFAFPSPSAAVSGFLKETTDNSRYRGPACFSRTELVRSVADEAGLGNFVYLRGSSGQRYIFSAIEQRRAGLYNRALFAVADTRADTVVIADTGDIELDEGQLLYVHLLADDGPSGSDVVRDLSEARTSLS